MKLLLIVLCALNSSLYFPEAAKILAVIPFPVKSHYAPFEPLLKRLSERGHELRVISHFAQKEKVPNFVDIDVSTGFFQMVGNKPIPSVDNATTWRTAKLLWGFFGPKICTAVLGHPEVKRLIESNEKFDLLISEIFSGDCFLGFVHKFGVPYVGVSSSAPMPWLPDVLANPDNPSYVPQLFGRSSDRMNYPERFVNAFYLLALKIGYRIYADEPCYEIAKGHFGPDLPSLDHLRSRVGLVLVNGHPSVTTPRALAPGVKEVGGIHIPSSGPGQLPRDLEEYLDSATEGAVYFSLGSQLNSTTFPPKNMAVLRQTFASLPQRVLWKCNEEEMPGLPENVKCIEWAPQLSVLCAESETDEDFFTIVWFLVYSSSMKLLVGLLCGLNFLLCFSRAAKILAVITFPSRSHYTPFEPLLKRLSERGHELEVISNFPQKVELPNFIDIDVSSSLSHPAEAVIPLPTSDDITVWGNAKSLMEFVGPSICGRVLDHPGVKRLIESDEKFDLIISEVFITDCFLGFVHKFQVPYVGLVSSAALPWLPEVLANPDLPSYIPTFFHRGSDRMNFSERFLNAFYLLALKIGYRIYADNLGHEIAKGHFGPDLPSLDHLRSRAGLVLVNGHPSVTTPRALAPGVKEVGGIHIPSSGPGQLPRDLEEYLDSATEGVVYFSLGSQLNSTTFPAKNMAVFRQAFASLPQRVLWKCSEREMPGLPKNVKCIDWAPQLSVLCHPNVRVFFSHGGLLGIQEAVYCGVPILGMPLFGDQFMNVAHAVDQGFALKTDFHNPSYEELSKSLNLLLTDPSYSESAREASSRFRDRPQAPLDEAVFWVEYVLRHGPEALRTAASELAWYQYLLLDVVAGVVIVLLAGFWILRKLAGAIFPGQKAQVKIRKEKKN